MHGTWEFRGTISVVSKQAFRMCFSSGILFLSSESSRSLVYSRMCIVFTLQSLHEWHTFVFSKGLPSDAFLSSNSSVVINRFLLLLSSVRFLFSNSSSA